VSTGDRPVGLAPGRIKLTGVSIETTTIEIVEADYRAAKRGHRLDHELDVYLSDMDGHTLVIEPDGEAVNPYDGPEDLMAVLEPVLAHVPTADLAQYLTDRLKGAE
jgi:hypothetical protein